MSPKSDMNLDPVLVHQIVGVLIVAFAIVMLLREIDVLRQPWAEYLPASALLFLGVLLFLDPWLFHGGDFGGGQGLRNSLHSCAEVESHGQFGGPARREIPAIDFTSTEAMKTSLRKRATVPIGIPVLCLPLPSRVREPRCRDAAHASHAAADAPNAAPADIAQVQQELPTLRN
jgi:hypothetical protein